MPKTITVYVQRFAHTKKSDPSAPYNIDVDDDIRFGVEGSTFRLSACGNHIISPIRGTNGKRILKTMPTFLYGSGVVAKKGRKTHPLAPNDFRKAAREWTVQADRGRISSCLVFQ